MAITHPDVEHSPATETPDCTTGIQRAWSFVCSAWQVSRDIEMNYASEDPETQERLKANVAGLFDQSDES